MHIPDGYLGPTTYVACYAAVVPFWAIGWRHLQNKLASFEVPYLAVAAAFVFLVMMFNVPVPGGTSAHVTGASLVAIALGFWPAVLAVSCALVVQAVVFGDGGLTAIGANALNMAVIQPLATLIVWRMLSNRNGVWNRRAFVAAFLAGYVGIVASAFMTAVEFGIQPALERAADGMPLYCPFPLSIAVPAMVVSHLLIGILEGAVTAFALQALARAGVKLQALASRSTQSVPLWNRKGFWVAVALTILAVPVGLWLPEVAGAGEAWGEWAPSEAAKLANLSAVPAGMAKWADLWSAPVPDYTFRESESFAANALQYTIAGVLGVVIITAFFWMLDARRPSETKQGNDSIRQDAER